MFPIPNSLNLGDTLSPLLFNCAAEYAIRPVPENQKGLRMNAAHQRLSHAEDVNVVRENINTTKKNTEAILNAGKETSLEVNLDRPTYMLVSRYGKAGQKHSIKIANRSFEYVGNFEYMGTTPTDQN
jgi:hypothetical protein